jgi:hypothetical protein
MHSKKNFKFAIELKILFNTSVFLFFKLEYLLSSASSLPTISLLIAGGAVTTWLTLLFDRTSKRRQEYLGLCKDKISKISKIEPRYYKISSFLKIVARLIDGGDVYRFMYFIGKYLNSWWDILDTNGYIPLDDIYGEDVLQEFVQYTYLKLKGS